MPSTAVFRYLAAFHEKVEVEERVRRAEKAFIPKPNVYLAGLAKLNEDLVAYIQSRRPQKAATLDMDATLRLKHCMATSISRPTSR